MELRRLRCGEAVLGGPRFIEQPSHRGEVRGLQPGHPPLHPLQQGAVHVVAAQGRVAGGGEHGEDAVLQVEDRDVEGAAAQVVDRELAGLAPVQAVGQGRGRGLVQQAQHVQAGEAAGVLGGLALGVIEVGGHGDHRALQLAAQGLLGALAEEA